jgi:hypothetical protein
VSQSQISSILQGLKLNTSTNDVEDSVADWTIRVITKHVPMPENYKHMGQSKSTADTSDQQPSELQEEPETPPASHESEVNTGQVAPGQLITHYAPDVPTYILRTSITSDSGGDVFMNAEEEDMREQMMLDTVVLDFNGSLSWLVDKCLAYQDMSPQVKRKIQYGHKFILSLPPPPPPPPTTTTCFC